MVKKKILILNPNTSEESAKQMAEECRKVAAPGTEVVSTYIRPRKDFSSYAVLCYVDMAICAMEAVKLAWKERRNVDGIVVAGFSDVGLDAMKELLDIPVIGIAEAAYHVASLLGHRFAVLTGTSKWTPPKHDYVKAVGVESKAVSFRSYSEWDEISSHEVLKNKLVEAARKSIEEDGAEVIILGGGPLAGYGKEVEKEIGVPVIDPAINAFKLLEGLIDLGLKQSKICRWKKPMESLGNIPYNRRWLDTD
jgi:allantoin racemase